MQSHDTLVTRSRQSLYFGALFQGLANPGCNAVSGSVGTFEVAVLEFLRKQILVITFSMEPVLL